MLTTFMAIMMPVIALLMIAVINVSHVVYAKIRLQDAADRAAYVGAAKQAYIMNRMGEDNLAIQKRFSDLKEELTHNSKQTVEKGRERVSQVRSEIMGRWQEMEAWNDGAWETVRTTSQDLLSKGYAGAWLIPQKSSRLLTLLDHAETDQYQKLKFDGMRGDLFFDPADHDDGEDSILSYLVKDPLHEVRWEVTACAVMPNLLLASKFQNINHQLCASAAAQPHGGSIRSGAPYQVSFVPIRRDHVRQ
ncbi:MAG: hypothetical protein COV45_06950 [Deltaproteobacteria bacterium CG11_big_fil_rev_8_21_14_0_20_47_16]|nr:MAG: hypothetical protein COV45_06950 [Deltaproteobacteria bacterium CG11_big_fil_rev_8_21_14_0_20_47_16]